MKSFQVSADGIYAWRTKLDEAPADLNSNHCHDKYEILYIIKGQGRCVIEGIEYPIKPRTVFVFPPLVYHVVCIDEGTSYDRAVMHFDKKCVAESVADILEGFGTDKDSVSPAAFYHADVVSDQIASLFDRVEISESFPAFERGKFLGLLLSELILLVSMASRDSVTYDEGELGARVIRYLNEYVDRDISLDELAKRFFVSKYYLCRAFKKHNGISVHGYINQKRVMYAKQLIEAGETASRAAYRVGFGDYSAFYRAYVKIVGNSPTAQTLQGDM